MLIIYGAIVLALAFRVRSWTRLHPGGAAGTPAAA